MPKLVSVPTTATASSAAPIFHGSPCQRPEQDAAGGGAQDDGDEGAHLEQAVGARELLVRQHFRQDAVLGGAEEGGLVRDEEEHGQHADRCVPESERRMAATMATISKLLVTIRTVRLLKTSASQPA